MKRVTVKGNKFVDESGREILLQGINFVCKEKKQGYLWPEHKKLFAYFAQWGFNLIRLGIFWDAVEPEPGVYDEDYLEIIAGVIADAEQYDMYVLLDMHQDLWSVSYGDGAPEWATLTDGAAHPTDCAMWFDAYLRSDAVINAADHFWKNDPAADGIGLMDHYQAMWEKIAKTFENCRNIIGFEPMNEPFMGSIARNSFGMAAIQTRERYPEFDFSQMKGITPETQEYFMSLVGESFLNFDKETLMPFYKKMDEAIRESGEIPLATGGNIYCSSQFPCGISRVKLSDDREEKWQFYAPHGYDSVVDSEHYENFSKENVKKLFADKRETQKRLEMPVLVGEWGAFPSKDFTNDLIDHMNEILEQYLWNSAYWQYIPGMEKDKNFSALRRAYPAVTDGKLISYHYDRQEESLKVSWKGKDVLCYLPFDSWKIDSSISDTVSISEENMKKMDQASWVRITAGDPQTVTTVCIKH